MSRVIQAYQGRPKLKERHWLGFVILPLFLLIWFLDGPYQRFYDVRDAEAGDWVSAPEGAPIIVVHDRVGPDGKPLVTYTPCARREVRGDWTARTEIKLTGGDFVQLQTASGDGSYRDCVSRLRAWDWLFNRKDVSVPLMPYRICVFYDLTAPSGVTQRTESYCSEEVTP